MPVVHKNYEHHAPCGSGLAREDVSTVNIYTTEPPLS
ncbi:hypothetical protein J3D47_002549 [Pseudomonas laurylsulfativorans]|uniref:Uncharacterized protein n=1 Tax=Pseudomonas fluorescens TaxID=294 RepID=A0A5E6XQ50_PSEFL|nr:hypothetical protein [Pseudomonas laurylsulfativorans]VVN43096.1 hypothetical protein PS659_05586 [Pseudomonas fluorescens]